MHEFKHSSEHTKFQNEQFRLETVRSETSYARKKFRLLSKNLLLSHLSAGEALSERLLGKHLIALCQNSPLFPFKIEISR